jgi:hypothetical protein
MNRARRLFMTTVPGRKSPGRPAARVGAIIVGAIGLSGSLSGCVADPFNHPTDPSSPVAAEVNQLANTNAPYPRWSQFPAAPKNVPTLPQFAAKARDVSATQTQLLTEASQIQWTLNDPDALAREARARIDPTLAVPAVPNAMADVEAWAAEARARATPPPPPR